MTTIRNFEAGAKVRSYDFPGRRTDCYIEGTVVARDRDFYQIRVERQVVEGTERPASSLIGELVTPPVNGLKCMFGDLTNGVEAI